MILRNENTFLAKYNKTFIIIAAAISAYKKVIKKIFTPGK